MTKKIWFDMDGTIADLYGVTEWLEMLTAHNPYPYMVAKPMVNMNALARALNRLTKEGWEINVISWLADGSDEEYDELVADAKIRWLRSHLKSVRFTRIDIVAYGTPKQDGRNGILFDDCEQNRIDWGENSYDEKNILEVMRHLYR